jgi:hypothetical protein
VELGDWLEDGTLTLGMLRSCVRAGSVVWAKLGAGYARGT